MCRQGLSHEVFTTNVSAGLLTWSVWNIEFDVLPIKLSTSNLFRLLSLYHALRVCAGAWIRSWICFPLVHCTAYLMDKLMYIQMDMYNVILYQRCCCWRLLLLLRSGTKFKCSILPIGCHILSFHLENLPISTWLTANMMYQCPWVALKCVCVIEGIVVDGRVLTSTLKSIQMKWTIWRLN